MATPLAPEKLLTADEFMALDDDPSGGKMELHDGRVVVMPPTGDEHSEISANVFIPLQAFVRSRRTGAVRFEVGFTIRTNPDRVVAPDVAYAAALDPNRDRTKYIPGSPTLAVEVVSPTDKERDVADKVLEYLDAGSERVWVVRPTSQTVTVHRPNGDSHTYRMGDTLTSDDAALPEGFSLTLEAIFATD